MFAGVIVGLGDSPVFARSLALFFVGGLAVEICDESGERDARRLPSLVVMRGVRKHGANDENRSSDGGSGSWAVPQSRSCSVLVTASVSVLATLEDDATRTFFRGEADVLPVGDASIGVPARRFPLFFPGRQEESDMPSCSVSACRVAKMGGAF